MPQKPVTEQQILDAIDEHSKGWVEQLARRAKNQRLVLSDHAICELGECLEMPELMDQIVQVRIEEKGPFTLGELIPSDHSRSVADVMAPMTATKLTVATSATLSVDDICELIDYHLSIWDDNVLEVLIGAAKLSREDLEFILDVYDYGRDRQALMGQPLPTAGRPRKKRHVVHAVLFVLGTVTVVALALAGGIVVLGTILAIALLVAFLTASSGARRGGDKFADARSDYNRRAWADDHDFGADGDLGHNYDADGD